MTQIKLKMDGSFFVQMMVENLERVYTDDPDLSLTQEEQYLLEKVQTLEDLWDFLEEKEGIYEWGPEEVFGFTLCLVFVEPGFDGGPNAVLSPEYQQAKANAEKESQRRDFDIFSGHAPVA